VTDQGPVRRRHDTSLHGFASDNYAGVHPAVLDSLAAANGGHQPGYGHDAYTERLSEVMKGHFGQQAETFCVLNGTGANVVALQAMTERWDGVVCADSAHVNVDECGAPERVAGLKLLAVETVDGKMTPGGMASRLGGLGDEHRAQPSVLSLSQATEYGTCYSIEELASLCQEAHSNGLRVHLDGARLSNAAAWLGVPLRAFTTDVGVDVVCVGGTKNGAMLGEAVVVLDPEAVRGIKYLRKASLQLASKMRFISVQLEALFGGDLWLVNAGHANAMAQELAQLVARVPGVEVTRPVQANSVFARLPAAAAEALRHHYAFYTWDEAVGEVRWMTSFDTVHEDVESFARRLAQETAAVAQS
jgi:threonine aldolase